MHSHGQAAESFQDLLTVCASNACHGWALHQQLLIMIMLFHACMRSSLFESSWESSLWCLALFSPFVWNSLIIPFLKKEEAFTQSIWTLIDLSIFEGLNKVMYHSFNNVVECRKIYLHFNQQSSTNKKEKVQTHKRTMWHVQICRNLALFPCLFAVPKLLSVGYFGCRFHSILITIVQRICLLTLISRGGWGSDCSM